eukprot:TRINITY_DN13565_c1_g1_i2.p2 TRINITY_DN13565_c1_g1~~TRINITY_DN13565_c1_g1_i2.p2  ORF type:complete len:201 (+),score=11.91 TRINITY_DN13565_c1_g1_i2:240-842(+)
MHQPPLPRETWLCSNQPAQPERNSSSRQRTTDAPALPTPRLVHIQKVNAASQWYGQGRVCDSIPTPSMPTIPSRATLATAMAIAPEKLRSRLLVEIDDAGGYENAEEQKWEEDRYEADDGERIFDWVRALLFVLARPRFVGLVLTRQTLALRRLLARLYCHYHSTSLARANERRRYASCNACRACLRRCADHRAVHYYVA